MSDRIWFPKDLRGPERDERSSLRRRRRIAGVLMRVQVRVLDARVAAWGFPHYGSAASAGLDLHACLDGPLVLEPEAPPALISSGLAIRIGDPEWCGLVAPRSGLGHRGLVLGNAVGIIDADYEGPCLISAWNRNPAATEAITIQPGDRIAQLLFVRIARPTFELVDSFEGEGGRGAGGFGSTGLRQNGSKL
jgi:dUTP pyrophosphatase